MKRWFKLLFFVASCFLFSILTCPSLQAADYYAAVDISSGNNLLTSLSRIINTGTKDVGYNGLWSAYATTDCKPGTNIIWDMYSNEEYVCGGSKQGASYKAEGDSYNREHVVPQSWFSEASPMKADLFHVYPTDGYVNNRRSNYLHGETNNPTYTSLNGSKLGSSSFPGYTGTVFEPIDEYKGDFARSYFYMATRYYNKVGSWTGESQSVFKGTFPYLTTYAVNLFTKWSVEDPVSEKETTRNDAVYSLQKNRNPFIDHPEYIRMIWPSEYNDVDETVPNLIEAIFGLPEIITLNDAATVHSLKDTYDTLTEEQKLNVTNASILNDAVQVITLLENNSFVNLETMASLKIQYDGTTLEIQNLVMRFGSLVPKSTYQDASYGVLITSGDQVIDQTVYVNTNVKEFVNQHVGYKALDCPPALVSIGDNQIPVLDENGDTYQFAWVITDMEGHYKTTLHAVSYMYYDGNLYLCQTKSFSVIDLAKYYVAHSVELKLTDNQKTVLRNLAYAGMIGGDEPGDVQQDFWS